MLDSIQQATIRQETVVKPGEIVEQNSPEQDQKWAKFYEDVVGAWKDDLEINQIFEEIDQARHLDYGRETPVFGSIEN
jgi:hypothetical protein